MTKGILEEIFSSTDPKYKEAMQLQGRIQGFLEDMFPALKDYIQKFDRFTIMPVDSRAEPYGHVAYGRLYTLAKDTNYLPAFSNNGDIKICESDLSRFDKLGMVIGLDYTESSKNRNLLRKFYSENKEKLGIDYIVYVTSFPLNVEDITLNIGQDELPFEKKTD